MGKRQIAAMLELAGQGQRRNVRLAMILAALAALSGVALLGLSGWFITGAALAGAGGVLAAQGFNYLTPSAAIRLFAISRTGARYGERLLGHKAALFTLAGLRSMLFGRLARLQMDAPAAGDVSARLLQDVQALEDRLIRVPASAGALAGWLLAASLSLLAGSAVLLAFALLSAMVLAAAWILSRHLFPGPAAAMQSAIGDLKAEVTEYAACSAEIAAYALQRPVVERLMRRAGQADGARLRLDSAEMLLAALTPIAAGLVAAASIAFSSASLPITFLATLAAAGAIEGLSPVVQAMGREAVAAAGLERLEHMLEVPQMQAQVDGVAVPDADVSLRIGSIILRPGDRLTITGPSGSGKTSMIECLAGWRTQCVTPLAIGGVPCDPASADVRRRLFALSSQDAPVIAGTIADNLRLARPGLQDRDLWAALETACLADDVRAMPDGLLSWTGDAGQRLSGGQRKRLSLARALLAARPWLLLDEPGEGLDPETEDRMIGNLDRWLRSNGVGLVLITHRPALLALADRHLQLAG